MASEGVAAVGAGLADGVSAASERAMTQARATRPPVAPGRSPWHVLPRRAPPPERAREPHFSPLLYLDLDLSDIQTLHKEDQTLLAI